MDGEVCEVDDNNEEFCVKDTSVETSFSLNFAGKAPISSTQCSTYTRPDYMADMGPGCWKIDVAMDMGAMMDEAMSGELEDSSMMTDEEAMEFSAKYFEITECSSSFYDGTTCDCGFCDEGMGVSQHLQYTAYFSSNCCADLILISSSFLLRSLSSLAVTI